MRLRHVASVLSLFLLSGAPALAGVLRVVVVQTENAAGYAKALEQGNALLKSKGSSAVIRVWRARFAGPDTGAVVASVEYPSLEALARDDARMASDPELRAWLQSLAKLRKIVSDSVYEELAP
ncbi:MAG TPA: hypothetical protein VLI67_10495 [Vicinamibacteria bacterium]|nr:hypothetical protein [Vicinamibacteria bacterium]